MNGGRVKRSRRRYLPRVGKYNGQACFIPQEQGENKAIYKRKKDIIKGKVWQL